MCELSGVCDLSGVLALRVCVSDLLIVSAAPAV